MLLRVKFALAFYIAFQTAAIILVSGAVSLAALSGTYYPMLVSHGVTQPILGIFLLLFSYLILAMILTAYQDKKSSTTTMMIHEHLSRVTFAASVKELYDKYQYPFLDDLYKLVSPNVEAQKTTDPVKPKRGFIKRWVDGFFKLPKGKKFTHVLRIVMVFAGGLNLYQYVRTGLPLFTLVYASGLLALAPFLDQIAHAMTQITSILNNITKLTK